MPHVDLKKVWADLFRPLSPKRPANYKEAVARLLFARQLAAYHWVIPMVKGKRVLEVGANRGYGLRLFMPHAEFLVGAELSERLSKIAHAETGVPVVRANGEHLPFADGSFDLIVSFQVVEHVWDDRAYAAEIARTLAPGGKFIVTTPDQPGRLFNREVPRFDEHLREYTAASYAELLHSAFGNVEVKGLLAEDQAFELERMRNWRRAEAFYFQGLLGAPLRFFFRTLRKLRRRPKVDADYVNAAADKEAEEMTDRFVIASDQQIRWDHLIGICTQPLDEPAQTAEQAWSPTDVERWKTDINSRVSMSIKEIAPDLSLAHPLDPDLLKALTEKAAGMQPGETLAFLDGAVEARGGKARLRGVNFWQQALPLAGFEFENWLPTYRRVDPIRGVSTAWGRLSDKVLLARMPWLAKLGIVVAKRMDAELSQSQSQTIDEERSQQTIHEERARSLATDK